MAEIVSPKASGGGGTAFEFKVQASFLATMLVNGRYPCLPDGKAHFIRFQARQLGYHTDDIFVQLQTPSGDMYRLLAQIKANITFTQSNNEFPETVIAAWTDFTNAKLFNRDKDFLAIISGPGSKKEIRHFRPLLDWSRSSESAEEFFRKVSTQNYASEDTRRYLSTIHNLLKENFRSEPSQDELWRFMKRLHWVSYDFDEPSSHDLSIMLSMLQLGMKVESAVRPENIWDRLLRTAMDYNPAAGSLTRESLVDALGDCVVDFRLTEGTGLQRLTEHAEGILAVVQTRFRDGTHLDRKWLLQALWDFLSDHRLLLVTGVAGVGKSAAIKEMVQSFARHIPTFVLKADELDRPHLHQVLTEIGVEESIHKLSSRFGLLEQKVFIVESLEKLLEADCLDAFHQLLHLVVNDPTWMVVLSCRSHALGTVRNEILIPQSISPTVLEIPLLSDFELQQVASEHTGLDRLFHNESLKELLRVPMYLSYACLIDWDQPADSIEELDVNKFEQILWDHVIRKEKYQKDGIHLLRERCFIRIAVTRAKNMTPFVLADPFDASALQQLEADDLVIRTEEGVAPAHDLFEEWAISRRIGSLFREFRKDLFSLFGEIGGEPAMRRGFRTWLVDQLARHDSEEVADFITNVSQNQDLPGFWRDEVIVAVFLSPQACRYFANQKERLLSNDLKYLSRVIHLLRTACKEPDTKKLEMLPLTPVGRDFFKAMLLKPSGSGWKAAVEFIGNHLDFVGLTHVPLIAGMLQDWVSGLEAGVDLPSESRTVGLIAIHLLNLTRETYSDDLRTDVLRIAFRVSIVISEELHALFNETLGVPTHDEDDEGSIPFMSVRKRRPDEFRFYQSILDGAVESFHCFSLCDSMPDRVVALAKKNWLRPAATSTPYQRRHLDIEPYFGMERRYGFEMYPPSALQGPFLFLLKSHPQHGVDLILELINTATERYAYSGLDSAGDEPIHQVTVQLNDRRKISQYISWRLWGAYRGLSVMPHVLESALMALEKWLLDLAKDGNDITDYFDQLLSGSSSCAISAVLVSVAARYSEHLGDHLLPLLRTKEFFALDMSRMIAEGSLVVDMGAVMGLPEQVDKKLFIDEREEAQKMPHRKWHLEWSALNLQTGPLREQVQLIIDEHHRNLPPLESQTDEDRTWRLALHRMDLRQYRAEKAVEEDKILISPVPPESDIQEMQSRDLPEIEHQQKLAQVAIWARHAFHQGPTTEPIFENWGNAIAWAQATYRELLEESETEKQMWLAGPIYIAALSIRDHLVNLGKEETAWCSNILKEKVLQGLNVDPRSGQPHTGVTDGTAAAANVLPLLLDVVASNAEELRVAIVVSLTYPEPRVRASAIQAAHHYLWPNHTSLAKSCLIGLLEFARLSASEQEECRRLHADLNYAAYKKKEEAIRAKYRKEKHKLRIAIVRGKLAHDFDPGKLTFEDYSIYDLASAVQMLPVDRGVYDSEPLLMALVEQTLKTAKDKEAHRRDGDPFLHEFNHIMNEFASFFVLKRDMETAKRLCAPIAASIEDCPKYVAEFVESLILNAIREQSDMHFWNVWHIFADVVFSPDRLGDKFLRYGDEKLIMTLMLATVPWKPEVKEWKTLSDNPTHLKAASKAACKTKPGFQALVSLLDTVGGFYLPEAFTWLADALPHLDIRETLGERNNRYALETLLQREIHLRATQIRNNSAWQKSVLVLLDVLVNFGSSTAFQLRERIIRPPKKR